LLLVCQVASLSAESARLQVEIAEARAQLQRLQSEREQADLERELRLRAPQEDRPAVAAAAEPEPEPEVLTSSVPSRQLAPGGVLLPSPSRLLPAAASAASATTAVPLLLPSALRAADPPAIGGDAGSPTKAKRRVSWKAHDIAMLRGALGSAPSGSPQQSSRQLPKEASLVVMEGEAEVESGSFGNLTADSGHEGLSRGVSAAGSTGYATAVSSASAATSAGALRKGAASDSSSAASAAMVAAAPAATARASLMARGVCRASEGIAPRFCARALSLSSLRLPAVHLIAHHARVFRCAVPEHKELPRASSPSARRGQHSRQSSYSTSAAPAPFPLQPPHFRLAPGEKPVLNRVYNMLKHQWGLVCSASSPITWLRACRPSTLSLIMVAG
jgi:hypothetical protein